MLIVPSQYMVATMLVFNRLLATDYTDGSEAATSPLVESLRTRIKCVEDPQFTKDYHEASLRSIPNALTVTLNDGTVGSQTKKRGGKTRDSQKVPETFGAALCGGEGQEVGGSGERCQEVGEYGCGRVYGSVRQGEDGLVRCLIGLYIFTGQDREVSSAQVHL